MQKEYIDSLVEMANRCKNDSATQQQNITIFCDTASAAIQQLYEENQCLVRLLIDSGIIKGEGYGTSKETW